MCINMPELDQKQLHSGPFPDYHGMLTGNCVWMGTIAELHAPEAIQCNICAYWHPINKNIFRRYVAHM